LRTPALLDERDRLTSAVRPIRALPVARKLELLRATGHEGGLGGVLHLSPAAPVISGKASLIFDNPTFVNPDAPSGALAMFPSSADYPAWTVNDRAIRLRILLPAGTRLLVDFAVDHGQRFWTAARTTTESGGWGPSAHQSFSGGDLDHVALVYTCQGAHDSRGEQIALTGEAASGSPYWYLLGVELTILS
ncbi:MAG: hypothetical protein KC420_16520, partial [Myxococcales bacterium]|nr:hypothetical protein [Myxococcales bacterium]